MTNRTARLALFLASFILLTLPGIASAESPLERSGFHLVEVGSTAGLESHDVALLVELQSAQFHHLRAMHGVGWALTGTLLAPNLILLGGGVMVAGYVSGLFGGSSGVLIGGIVMVGIGAALLIGGIPTLIGNIIQAAATSARVESLRAQLSERHARARPVPAPSTPGPGFGFAVAF